MGRMRRNIGKTWQTDIHELSNQSLNPRTHWPLPTHLSLEKLSDIHVNETVLCHLLYQTKDALLYL